MARVRVKLRCGHYACVRHYASVRIEFMALARIKVEMWCGLEARVRDEVRIEPVCGNEVRFESEG